MSQVISPASPGPPQSLYRVRKNPVKLTALLYLKEALLEERYEECPEFIAVAFEFGASTSEIQNVLENPRRKVAG